MEIIMIFEGYVHIKPRKLSGNFLSWRCEQKNCKGRLRTKKDTVDIITDHCHFPDSVDIQKK